MTYIEFFDKTATENICACLINPPERVILIGDKMKLLKKHADRYSAVFANRGYDVEFLCRSINKSNMQNIIDALSDIIENTEDCVFDLTGGEELYLVAMGIVAERYKDKHIQMHRFNVQNGTIIDCDQDGQTIAENEFFEMSIEENIQVYGGAVVYDTIKENGTHEWEMTVDFKEDLQAMWEICKADVRLWNVQINVLEGANTLSLEQEDPLRITVPAPELENYLSRKGRQYICNRSFLKKLYDKDLIIEYEFNETFVTFTFKNEQVKKCLTKAGQILEMIIYMAAIEAQDKNGCATYNDVMNGVCIDWDGEIHPEGGAYDTENEIDVMMMHGIVPVFVSCKNGMVEVSELYKLNSVAERFGGRYAKKILVATALDSKTTFDEYFRQRAEDMQIRVIEGVQEMSEGELIKLVRSFWNN